MTESEPYETLLIARQNAVATVTLNRPEKRNAVTWVMWQELLAAFRGFAIDEAIRIVIVTGAGSAFCSGADLGGELPDIHPYMQLEQINEVVLTLHRLPKITIARVDGDAVGAGANLALACDMVVASEESRFAEIFVKRGLSLDCGGSWILPRLIGLHRAKELCLTGSLISAAEASTLGLINHCVDRQDLDTTINGLVERILEAAPMAQTLTKRLLNEGGLGTMAQALDREAQAQVINVGTGDLAEARNAFAERRTAKFNGTWVLSSEDA